jgi:hypothetical protein
MMIDSHLLQQQAGDTIQQEGALACASQLLCALGIALDAREDDLEAQAVGVLIWRAYHAVGKLRGDVTATNAVD